jgi:ribosomal protein S18 acetylase RimI-like enzyme
MERAMPTDNLVEIPAWRTSHFASWRLQVIRAAPTGSDYDDIIELRSRMYGIPRGDAGDEVDGYSTLYCAYAGGAPVGTMRVTAALDGRLDCEEFYPHALLEAFRPRLGSASRFAVRQDLPPGMQVARVLIEAAWLHQIRRGIRLDVTNAHRRALRYYERIGYRPVAGCRPSCTPASAPPATRS